MIHYSLSCANRLSQIIQVKLTFTVEHLEDSIALNLSAWRPGRYEFQHFARNIFDIKAHGADGKYLLIKKTARNCWNVFHAPLGDITVEYNYSCTQFDAGGSWIDDELIYINPINCLLYLRDRINEACELQLNFDLVSALSPASSLQFHKGTAFCNTFYELADSPFFISTQQEHVKYTVQGYTFHIWTHGIISYDKSLLLEQFAQFTEVQIAAMKEFPEQEYHFLLLLMPFQCYHGVEHHRSTVITLGPSQDLHTPLLYNELISISSHELYHAWNICKIRPQEMLPYRFEQENYFHTGFIAEGITSYLGEYFLRKSNFFSEEQFLQEIEQWFQRHENNRGLNRASLRESSFDLWVDGYVPSDFKVSIYVAGALSAIALDLLIRLQNPKHSIHDVMQKLYFSVARKNEGYTEESLKSILTDFIKKENCEDFWAHCITGHDVVSYVTLLLKEFGVVVTNTPSLLTHERLFGFKLKPSQVKVELAKLKYDAPAAAYLMPDDVIVAIDSFPVNNSSEIETALKEKTSASFRVLRKGRILEMEITATEKKYWSMLHVKKNSEASDEQKLRYDYWLV